MSFHETTELVGTETRSAYEIERNKPMPNRIHGTIQTKIAALLMHGYGEKYDFISELSLASTPPSTPDICIYPHKKLDIRTVEAKETEIPLTTIEIMSPSQSVNELMHKAWDIYFPMGVRSAWLVIPEFKSIYVLLPDNKQLSFNAGILHDSATGIEISVEAVFSGLV